MRVQGRTVCMDATASTNKHKFALTTMMVFVPDGPALPVAWLLHSSNSEATLLHLERAAVRSACLGIAAAGAAAPAVAGSDPGLTTSHELVGGTKKRNTLEGAMCKKGHPLHGKKHCEECARAAAAANKPTMATATG